MRHRRSAADRGRRELRLELDPVDVASTYSSSTSDAPVIEPVPADLPEKLNCQASGSSGPPSDRR